MEIASLFWSMAVGSVIIWLVVISLAVSFARRSPGKSTHTSRALIVGGGGLFPIVGLSALLLYGLSPLPSLVAPAAEGAQRITVTGEQWWWRVRYIQPDGTTVELANEIHLPVGKQVEFQLNSTNVIHSFWIPSLGGKMDMIPGRNTRLVLTPTRIGVFRGVCAEYCGASHALMRFNQLRIQAPLWPSAARSFSLPPVAEHAIRFAAPKQMA
jgi:cytochrome c oxidase subunit 2